MVGRADERRGDGSPAAGGATNRDANDSRAHLHDEAYWGDLQNRGAAYSREDSGTLSFAHFRTPDGKPPKKEPEPKK